MNEEFNAVEMVVEAWGRIAPYARRTYLEPSAYYSQLTGADVYFKCENLQHTGSFKVRGALNKILSLNEEDRLRGVVTASTGNHGAACAYAWSRGGGKGIVFVPHQADESKLAAISRLGAEIRTFGEDSAETEVYARSYATQHGLSYVSPYNDPLVVAGQGTIAMELLEQLPTVEVVLASVGGGGLIGGIASYVKAVNSKVQVIGCSPENSEVMARSVEAGQLLDLPSLPTLSDGTAGGVESGSMTFPLCRDFVDRFVSVSEEEIAAALREFIGVQHQLIEGSAAVSIAAFLKIADQMRGAKAAIVLCGANISPKTLKEVL